MDTPQLDDNDPSTPRGACTQDAPPTNAAGDREGTVTPPAEGAYFEGIRIFDVTNPYAPRLIKGVDTEPEVEFWHSATFSWDGKYGVYGDESLGGSCNTPDEADGRLWLYYCGDVANAVSSFLIPRTQGGDYCSAHLFKFLPFSQDKHYVLASSWYNGGVSMIDWTKALHPVEIGYYDRNEGEHKEGFWTGTGTTGTRTGTASSRASSSSTS